MNCHSLKVKKRKYFLSATEAEIEEGIIPYLGLTEDQKKPCRGKIDKRKLGSSKSRFGTHICIFKEK